MKLTRTEMVVLQCALIECVEAARERELAEPEELLRLPHRRAQGVYSSLLAKVKRAEDEVDFGLRVVGTLSHMPALPSGFHLEEMVALLVEDAIEGSRRIDAATWEPNDSHHLEKWDRLVKAGIAHRSQGRYSFSSWVLQ